MKLIRVLFTMLVGICLVSLPYTSFGQEEKTRILVVSSYQREYLWSQETNKGLCAAMLDFGYLVHRVGSF